MMTLNPDRSHRPGPCGAFAVLEWHGEISRGSGLYIITLCLNHTGRTRELIGRRWVFVSLSGVTDHSRLGCVGCYSSEVKAGLSLKDRCC